MARLLDPVHYSEIFEPLRGKRVGYVQGLYGNAGDALIHYATLGLFDSFGVNYSIAGTWEQLTRPGQHFDELALYGGGNMGAKASGELRSKLRHWSKWTTLLPQSWRGPEEAPYARVYARERFSLKFCPHARLAPDLALSLDHEPEEKSVYDVGLCLRADAESAFGGRGDDPSTGLGRRDAAAYLSRAALFKTIITDRLHFAVAGLLNRRRVILLPNSYHKNRGVWECWLDSLGCEWADTPEDAMDAAHLSRGCPLARDVTGHVSGAT